MYTIKKDVKVKDFDLNTKEFLCKAGFSEEDNISAMFEHFLEENGYELNEPDAYSKLINISMPLSLPNNVCESCYNQTFTDTILIQKGEFATMLKGWETDNYLYGGINTYKARLLGGIS